MSQPTIPEILTRVLRDSALARSSAYLSAMVGVVLVVSKLPYDVENPFEANGHPIAFPGVVGITNLFTYLRPEDRAGWNRLPTRDELADFAGGAAIGTAACSAMLGVAAARGWVSAPAWGWREGPSPGVVLASAALLA